MSEHLPVNHGEISPPTPEVKPPGLVARVSKKIGGMALGLSEVFKPRPGAFIGQEKTLMDKVHGYVDIGAEQANKVEEKLADGVEWANNVPGRVWDWAGEKDDQLDEKLDAVSEGIESFVDGKIDASKTAISGLRKFMLLTRVAWREETLNGTDGKGPSWWDRKVKNGLIAKDEVIKKTAADAVHGSNSAYRKGTKENNYKDKRKGNPRPLSLWESKINDRREAQAHKINKKRARAHNLRETHGEDVGMSARERKRSGLSPVPGTVFDRLARRGGTKQYKKTVNRIERGGRTELAMGSERLVRAAAGQTWHGRRRREKIEKVQQKIDSDKRELGITT